MVAVMILRLHLLRYPLQREVPLEEQEAVIGPIYPQPEDPNLSTSMILIWDPPDVEKPIEKVIEMLLLAPARPMSSKPRRC